MVFLWVAYGFQMVLLGIPMEFLVFFYGFPMVFLGVPNVFLWFAKDSEAHGD